MTDNKNTKPLMSRIGRRIMVEKFEECLSEVLSESVLVKRKEKK